MAKTTTGNREQGRATNFSISAQNPVASTRTFINGSALKIPIDKLKIGSCFRWIFNVTKTAAGAGPSIYDISFGTTGTTADTAIISFTKPPGTAVVDEGLIIICATIRTIGTTGVAVATFNLTHNLASTGHAVIPCINIVKISSVFDTTVANLIAGLNITTGTSDAITIQLVQSESWNL